MEHIKLIAIKFVATFVLLYLVLGMVYGMAIEYILFINMVSIVSYFIGDLIILERTNNAVTTLVDFGIALAVIYLMADVLTVGGDPLTAALFSAILIGIFEAFYHRYVVNELHEQKLQAIPIRRMEYSMETSEELSDYYDEEFDDDEDDFR